MFVVFSVSFSTCTVAFYSKQRYETVFSFCKRVVLSQVTDGSHRQMVRKILEAESSTAV